jgi:hypothetical protein
LIAEAQDEQAAATSPGTTILPGPALHCEHERWPLVRTRSSYRVLRAGHLQSEDRETSFVSRTEYRIKTRGPMPCSAVCAFIRMR